MEKLNWPLMQNNIPREDLDCLIDFLKGEPILTQSKNVIAFEEEWSKWLGVKYSVFVNSGASANLLTMAALKHLYGPGEIIVPTITWVSDIASVMQAGFKPVFVDVDPHSLGMDTDQILSKICNNTRAVFLTHVQGYNGLNDHLLAELAKRGIPLIEDVCESHGATHKGKKLGTFSLMSNFSFYYAHHMSTIEGGMVCTDNPKIYETVRMLRSHGLVREVTDLQMKGAIAAEHPDLDPEFIFAYPSYNVRSTELNAVLGRNQLKRLDKNNERRNENNRLFLSLLDPKKYWTKFKIEGSSNYALNLVMQSPDFENCERLMEILRTSAVEFRRGSSGGGNQLRQPYLRNIVPHEEHKKYPVAEHIHFFGFYIGNFPDLAEEKIRELCKRVNKI